MRIIERIVEGTPDECLDYCIKIEQARDSPGNHKTSIENSRFPEDKVKWNLETYGRLRKETTGMQQEILDLIEKARDKGVPGEEIRSHLDLEDARGFGGAMKGLTAARKRAGLEDYDSPLEVIRGVDSSGEPVNRYRLNEELRNELSRRDYRKEESEFEDGERPKVVDEIDA